MAISATNLTSFQSSTDATSYATASITPTANRLVLATVTSSKATTPDTPTLSGNGLTWVQIITNNFDTAGTQRTITMFRAMGSSPTSGAVTASFGGNTQTACTIIIDEFSGIDTSGTNGSGAIIQSAQNAEASQAANDFTVTLAAFSSVNNATYGSASNGDSANFTAGTGFASVGSASSTTPIINTLSEFRNDNDTTVTFGGAIGYTSGGIAVEIKSSGTSHTSTLAETLTLVDSIIRSESRVLTDTKTLVDVIIKSTLRTLSDTKTLVDTVLKNPSRALTDIKVLVDTVVKAPGKVLVDTKTLVDEFTRVWIAYKVLSEEATLQDTINKSGSRTLSDSKTLADSVEKSTSRTLSDSTSFVDTIIKSVSRTLSDTATLVDSLIKSIVRTLSDAASYIDTLITNLTTTSFSATLVESLSLSDTLSFVWDRVSNFSKKIIGLMSANKPVGGSRDKDNPTGFINQPKATGGISAKDKPSGLLNITDKPRMV